MKTNAFKILVLAISVMGLTGCRDDKDPELPYYDEIENEIVIAVLDNVPAYVYASFRDCVFICYSEYADEYYKAYNENHASIYEFSREIQHDIEEHNIGVKRSDFDKYGISLNSKVYVSASVTNNKQVKLDPNLLDAAFGGIAYENKAYLKNIKSRN